MASKYFNKKKPKPSDTFKKPAPKDVATGQSGHKGKFPTYSSNTNKIDVNTPEYKAAADKQVNKVSGGVYDMLKKQGIDKNYNLDVEVPSSTGKGFAHLGGIKYKEQEQSSNGNKEVLDINITGDDSTIKGRLDKLGQVPSKLKDMAAGLKDGSLKLKDIWEQLDEEEQAGLRGLGVGAGIAAVGGIAGAVGTGAATTTGTSAITRNAAGAMVQTKVATGAAAGAGKFAGYAKLLTGAYVVNEFLLSPSETANWAAVDNIAGVTAFQMNDILQGVQEGTITAAGAEESIERARDNIKGARNFVKKSTLLNPKMWAVRKTYLEAIQAAEDSLELKAIRMQPYL